MKILHFLKGRCNPDSANGVEKTISALAVGQARLTHTVSVWGVSKKPAIELSGIDTRCYYPLRIPWVLPPELVRDIERLAPDIVHFHSAYIPDNIVLAAALRKLGIPYVVTPNGNCSRHLLRRRFYFKIPYKLLFEKQYLNKALFVHAVGDQEEIRHYGVTVPIIEVPNGVDISSMPERPKDIDISDLIGEDVSPFKTFCYIGRLDVQQKGLDLLLHAFAQALIHNNRLFLILVGPDWKNGKTHLENIIKCLKIGHRVRFVGPKFGREKYFFVYAADFFVHTSRWEGMSLSVAEALACGALCLVSPPADPCGLIRKHHCGIMAGSDADTIAESILACSKVPSVEREAMSKSALDVVSKHMQWPEICAKITNAYTDFLSIS